jgi:hypothetical protein
MPAVFKMTLLEVKPIPYIYGSEYNIFLLSGITNPEILGIFLTLSLFVFWIFAQTIEATFSPYQLTVITHFFN